ncbi:LLM class flavin-dependent oxidoreductase [Streptomyces sanglieri]|uniref:LLM class flavin-dependent oxidoreductase n=1 Tax=Streptomyces sanglieri TaxID=193460 RepID=A0ABW2X4U1_9ACTN
MADQEAVIDAALSIGFSGLSMSAVAERLGISHSTLYRYFPSRDALAAAAADHAVRAIEWPEPGDDSRAFLIATAWAHWRLHAANPGLAKEITALRLTGPALVDRDNRTGVALLGFGFAPQDAALIVDMLAELVNQAFLAVPPARQGGEGDGAARNEAGGRPVDAVQRRRREPIEPWMSAFDPRLRAVLAEAVAGPSADWFERKLNLFLLGVAALHKRDGRMFDPEKIFAPRHRGEHFEVDGPLTLSRPPQGRPVIAQADASAGGRRLAARVADLVFVIEADRTRAAQQAGELRSLAADLGRAGKGPLFLPTLTVVPGRTKSEAEDAMARLEATADPKVMLANLSFYLGCDASGFALDEPLPPLPPSNASRSAQDRLVAEAQADNLTVRELALRQDSADTLVGSATEVADHIQEWFETRAADGFTVIPPYLPGALDSFVDLVAPELDRRGLLRPVRDGEMLWDRLGLERPAHRVPARSAMEDA